MPDIDIGWKVKLDELQSQLRASGALSNNEVRKLVGEMRSQFKKAESDAAKAAGKAAKEWDKKLGEISGAGKQMASLLGGSFGQLGNIVFELGGKLGGVVGPAGLATAGVAALGVGTFAMARAMNDFIDSADPAIERLKQIAGSEPIPRDAIASLDDYRQSSLAAEAAAAGLHVQVAAMAADAFEPAMATLAGLLTEINELTPSVTAMGEAVDFVNGRIRFFVGFMSLGAAELVRFSLGLDSVIGSTLGFETLADKGREAADGMRDLNTTLTDHDQAVKDRLATQTALTEELAFEKQALIDLGLVYDDTADLAREAAAAREAKSTAGQRLADEKELLAALEADRGVYYERVNAMHRGSVASVAAMNEEAAKHAQDIAQETLRQQSVAAAEGFGAIIDGIDAQIERQREAMAATGEAMRSAADLTGALSDAIIKGAEDGTVAQKQAALTLFRVSQATAIAAAAVDAIRAGVALIPGYAFLGPGAPAAAAATAAAAFATASAGILSQSPPSFQRGGMVATPGSTPDHRIIQTRADEAVLTGRGVRALGGPQGVEAANRGAAAQAQPTVVHLHVDGRKLATARVDPLGSLLTGAPLGRRPLYG